MRTSVSDRRETIAIHEETTQPAPVPAAVVLARVVERDDDVVVEHCDLNVPTQPARG